MLVLGTAWPVSEPDLMGAVGLLLWALYMPHFALRINCVVS